MNPKRTESAVSAELAKTTADHNDAAALAQKLADTRGRLMRELDKIRQANAKAKTTESTDEGE